ncbi:MAG: LysR family transcriptional regulator [Rhodothalassiaceae bacterium]
MAAVTSIVRGNPVTHPENWDDYRFFLSVVEHGNYSAAARALRVSQPTVSRRIAHLEERLGLRLFEQRPEGPVLTGEGQALLSVANGLRQYAIQLRRVASGLQDTLTGTIVLTTTQGLAEHWLPPRLQVFQEQYPEIEIAILAGHKRVDLVRHQADIAIRFGDPISADLVGRRMGYARCSIYGAETYFEQHGRPESLETLKDHRLIGALEDMATLPQNAELAAIAGPVHGRLSTNNINVQLSLAQNGMGLVCAPGFMAYNYPALQAVLTDSFEHRIDLWLLTHRDLQAAPRIRVLLDFLYEEFQRDLALFQEF